MCRGSNPLADYDGSFEVELGRDGFFLLPSKALKARVREAFCSWPGFKGDRSRLHFASHASLGSWTRSGRFEV